MTTFTSRGVPMAEGSDAADIAGRVNPVAQIVHDRPGVSAFTTAQRNALAGSDLWAGRVIFNTTTQAHEVYRSDLDEWHEGLEAPGSIKEWAPGVVPAGWRKADGAALSRTTYAALFARIGTTFGAGDGATTFNLPNRAGRFGLGVNGSHPLGQTGGAETHVLTVDEMPSHNHGVNDPGHTHQQTIDATYNPATGGFATLYGQNNTGANGAASGFRTGSSGTGISTQNKGGGQAHNNMPPFLATNVLIKI